MYEPFCVNDPLNVILFLNNTSVPKYDDVVDKFDKLTSGKLNASNTCNELLANETIVPVFVKYESPFSPVSPLSPLSPLSPVFPVFPLSPFGPAGPPGPIAPVIPATDVSTPPAIFAPISNITAAVTAAVIPIVASLQSLVAVLHLSVASMQLFLALFIAVKSTVLE